MSIMPHAWPHDRGSVDDAQMKAHACSCTRAACCLVASRSIKRLGKRGTGGETGSGEEGAHGEETDQVTKGAHPGEVHAGVSQSH